MAERGFLLRVAFSAAAFFKGPAEHFAESPPPKADAEDGENVSPNPSAKVEHNAPQTPSLPADALPCRPPACIQAGRPIAKHQGAWALSRARPSATQLALLQRHHQPPSFPPAGGEAGAEAPHAPAPPPARASAGLRRSGRSASRAASSVGSAV